MFASDEAAQVSHRLRTALAEERLRRTVRAIVLDVLDPHLDGGGSEFDRRLEVLVTDLVDPAAAAALASLAREIAAALRAVEPSERDRLVRRWRQPDLGTE